MNFHSICSIFLFVLHPVILGITIFISHITHDTKSNSQTSKKILHKQICKFSFSMVATDTTTFIYDFLV